MNKKDIVFVVGNYKNGGVPMHATNLANAFAKKGYQSTILVTKEISDEVFFEKNDNVDIVVLSEYNNQHSNSKLYLKLQKRRTALLKFFKRCRYITRYFKEIDKNLEILMRGLRRSNDISGFIAANPNCIYIPFGIDYYYTTYYGGYGLNPKILYAERNAPELEYPENEKKHLLRIVKKADGVILQTKNELAFYNGTLKNAHVINNPVKANLPEPFIGDRRKTVVNFCRISKQKNLPLLIKAFIKFHDLHSDYSLEIYGNTVEKNEEDLKELLLNLIGELNAEAYIHILPPCSDVHNKVLDCAMFVSSSDFEGLSNSMIEAMSIGLPCVCTDCLGGGAREVITDGENGLLTPINDVDALFKAMCKIADDNELSRRCSENAAKIRFDLSAEKIAEKWLKVIEGLQ